MANTRRNSHDTGKIAAATATTALSNTSPMTQSPAKGNAYPILDNPIFVHVDEQNNNTIIDSNNALTASTKPGMLNGLPEVFTDIDLANHNHLNGGYIDDNLYKSYVIGKCLILISQLALQPQGFIALLHSTCMSVKIVF